MTPKIYSATHPDTNERLLVIKDSGGCPMIEVYEDRVVSTNRFMVYTDLTELSQEVKEEKSSRLPCGCLWGHTSNSVGRMILNCPAHLPQVKPESRFHSLDSTATEQGVKENSLVAAYEESRKLTQPAKGETERLRSPLIPVSGKNLNNGILIQAKVEIILTLSKEEATFTQQHGVHEGAKGKLIDAILALQPMPEPKEAGE